MSTPFIEQNLTYTENGRLLDEQGRSVMMEWERPVMQKVAEIIAGPIPKKGDNGKDVLNVGFGMGIIDSYIQTYHPRSHTIIEIHPSVIYKMLDDGWLQKRNLIPIFADWRAVYTHLPKYDGIFIDTWDEEFHEFLEFAPNLLKKDGKLIFFNNIKNDNNEEKIYPPYLEIVKALYDVEMIEIPVDNIPEDQEYWKPEWTTYHCPILTVKK